MLTFIFGNVLLTQAFCISLSPQYNTAAAFCLEGYASFQINQGPGNRLTASELWKNGVLRGAKDHYPLGVKVVGGPMGSEPSDLVPWRCPFCLNSI